MTMRGLGQKPVTDRATATGPHHVGGEAGLIDEDQALDIKARLLLAPGLTSGLDVGPVLFGCVQGFF